MDKPIENTYINIQSWMVSELNLKGNELMIYAIIYGFCQDKESRFKGGRSYLAKWTNSTIRGVQNNLNSLIEKGMISKHEKTINGIKVCDYYPINLPWERKPVHCDYEENNDREMDLQKEEKVSVGSEQSSLVGKKVPWGSEKSSLGVVKKVHQGGEKSSPHNIKGNIKGNIESSSSSDGGGVTPSAPTGDLKNELSQVIERWNALQNLGIKPVSRITPTSKRYKLLKARLREYKLSGILSAIDNISKSKFLQGYNKNGWTITFDWFVCPSNFPKVLEGNYLDDDPENGGKDGGSYAGNERNFEQRTGGVYSKSGKDDGAKRYNPADYFGTLIDS